MKIMLQPLGEISGSEQIIDKLAQSLSRAFGCSIEVLSTEMIPDDAFNTGRGQYNASLILDLVKMSNVPAGTKVLGIIDVDAYVPELNYVFGLADVNGSAAIISLVRLRQEFYGLPEDKSLFLDRVIKEAIHELGHVFGLPHCNNTSCVMHFSNSLHDTDIKQPVFCQSCKPQLML